jgi:hypothetical protein
MTDTFTDGNPGASLLAELTRLREVEKAGDELKGYIRHRSGCPLFYPHEFNDDEVKCNCGLIGAIVAYEAAKGSR